jgi:hypothetical protein
VRHRIVLAMSSLQAQRIVSRNFFLSKEIKMKSMLSSACLVALTLALRVPSAAQAADAKPDFPAQYAATAVGQSGSTAGKTFGLTIYVDAATADGEIEELASTLKHKGPDGLLSAMQDMKDKGRVAPTGSTGTGMRVVRIRPTTNGGRHIVLVTDRPISFPELYQGTRSSDYKFGIVVLNVDKDGKGTGSFAPLVKIKFNKKNELEIENYGQKPFRLTNVYRQK